MQDWVQQAADKKPKHEFLIVKGHKINYFNLNTQVSGLAHALRRKGIDKNARIGFSICSCANSISILLAIVRLHIPSILLNTNLSLNEAKKYLEVADATHLIYSKAKSPKYRYISDKIISLDFCRIFKEVRDDNNSESRVSDSWNISLPLISIFTSGTSGQPKLVEFTLKNFYANAMSSASRIGSKPDDIWYLTLPLYHIGGLAIIFRTLLLKTSIALGFKFDEKETTRSISETHSSIISLVPTMLYRMLKHSENISILQRMRVILVGGAPAHPSLVTKCSQYYLNLFLTYGMTETTSQVATAVPEEVYTLSKTVGLPLNGISLKILDKWGQALDFNQIGEISVSGKQLARGYWKAEKIEGYFKTGDIGYRDKNGYLFVLDRMSSLIISGGENIYPTEIEALLNQHEQITESCVIGIPDEEWGEKVVSMIEGNITKKEIRKYLKDKIANFKIPKQVHIVGRLPRLSTGKIARKEVKRKIYESNNAN